MISYMASMKNMKTFTELKAEMLKDPDFKKGYDELAPIFDLIVIIMQRRATQGLTQAELAKRMGTKQSAISRFESGNYNPTLGFLQKLADALDVKLRITVTK